MLKLFKNLIPAAFLTLAPINGVVLASAEKSSQSETGNGSGVAVVFLFLAILLISSKIGAIVEKLGQPAVIGEIGAGIVLSAIGYFGFHQINAIKHNEIMEFIAELGAVILLFQIGLESNIKDMAKVGINALTVAVIGVVTPFVLGSFVLAPILFPETELVSRLFVGAALVATSVGITAYVFREMKMTSTRACQTVLGAAVIDDVLGLVVLAIVAALASGGSVSVGMLAQITAKAFGFLLLAVLLGNLFAPYISKAFSKIHAGIGMKFGIALTFALVYAYVATLAGLAPIVGAFAAGLILDPVHFKNFDLPQIAHDLKTLKGINKEEKVQINKLIERHQHGHVEDLVQSVSLFLVPIFFVFTGLLIEFSSLLKPSLYIYAIIIAAAAIFGKIIAGVAAKGDFKEKLLVGVSMVPRGEVGLIFATVGKSLGAISDDLFSVIILVIIITTFVSPPAIKIILQKTDIAKA